MKRAFKLLVCLAVITAFGGTKSVLAQGGKPNVLMIVVDDLNDWVGHLGGNPQTKTPNIDRLARQGMVFTNAQAAATLCNPSRIATLVGVAPHVSGILENRHELRESSSSQKNAVTLPQHFQENGYTTMARGKIFHSKRGPKSDPQSWDIFSVEGAKNERIPVSNPTRPSGPRVNGRLEEISSGSARLTWKSLNKPKELTEDYQNALWAARFLTNDAPRSTPKPFFLACGIYHPHLPWNLSREYFGKFPTSGIQLPEVREDDYADIPLKRRKRLKFPTAEYKEAVNKSLQDDIVRAYLASISYADDCVGVLMNALERGPYKNNTIVVLWSDHGYHVGEKLRYKKQTLWEECCRVPFIFKGPGINRGSSSRVVSLLDLYPTLIDLAGLDGRSSLSGRSLKPLIQSPNRAWDFPAITSSRNGHSVRDARYRYILTADGEQLYDHNNDPNEFTNLAGVAAHASAKRRLQRLTPPLP